MDKTRIEHRRGKDDWQTPPEVFDPLDAEFGFTLDAAASHENHQCALYYTEFGLVYNDILHRRYQNGLNGLAGPWDKHIVWCNPPYSQWQKWAEKASNEASHGATVVMLLPTRTDTKAFHKYIWPFADVEIRFIKGRVRFVGAEHGAPFPSMIVIFRPPSPSNPDPIEDAFWTAPPLLTYLGKSGIVPD